MSTLFRNNTGVLLVGFGAIGSATILHDRAVLHIGSKNSGIIVTDYRPDVVYFLQQLLEEKVNADDFASVFSINAHAEILELANGTISIILREATSENPTNMLQVGINWDRAACFGMFLEKYSTVNIKNKKGKITEALAFFFIVDGIK